MKIKDINIHKARKLARLVRSYNGSLVVMYDKIREEARRKPIIRQVEARKLVGRGAVFMSHDGEIRSMQFDSDFFEAEVNYYQTWRGLRKWFGSFGKYELVNVIRGWK